MRPILGLIAILQGAFTVWGVAYLRAALRNGRIRVRWGMFTAKQSPFGFAVEVTLLIVMLIGSAALFVFETVGFVFGFNW